MKSRVLIVPIILMCLLMVGCVQTLPEIIVWDDANAANSIKAAEQIKKHWDLNSAALKTSLGKTLDTDEYFKLKEAIKGLDQATKAPTPLKEKDAGAILGWFGRFSAAATDKAILRITEIVTKIVADLGKMGITF